MMASARVLTTMMMAALVTVAAAAATETSPWSGSHPPSELADGDQYGARRETPPPPPPLPPNPNPGPNPSPGPAAGQATDHPPPPPGDLINKSPTPDFNFYEQSQKESRNRVGGEKDGGTRKTKRSYYPWVQGQVGWQQSAPYQSITVWQPPTYQLSRPYFVPIFGAPGRIPIFYPPQPIYINPGVPIDNPRPFVGPGYLPPKGIVTPTPPRPVTKPTTTTETPTPKPTPMSVDDRFNTDDDRTVRPTFPPFRPTFPSDDGEEGRPVWDVEEPSNEVQRPSQRPTSRTTQRPNQRPTQPPRAPPPRTQPPRGSSIVPTRRPRPPQGRTTTVPPLIHGPPSNIDQGAQQSNGNVQEAFEPPAAIARPTFPPPPPSRRPTPSRPRFTTTTSTPPPQSGPTNCVWAIISCCSASGEVRYDCFDQRGCPGAFWDNNPCDTDYAKAAIASALNFYDSKK